MPSPELGPQQPAGPGSPNAYGRCTRVFIRFHSTSLALSFQTALSIHEEAKQACSWTSSQCTRCWGQGDTWVVGRGPFRTGRRRSTGLSSSHWPGPAALSHTKGCPEQGQAEPHCKPLSTGAHSFVRPSPLRPPRTEVTTVFCGCVNSDGGTEVIQRTLATLQ